jgi:polar amino acid transport system substrate-binding protein
MNGTREIKRITAPILAIIFILLADGLACRAFTQQLHSEPSVPMGSTWPESPKLVLNSADGPPFSKPDGTGIIDLVVKEAFRRVGIEISIIAVPAERALRNASEGIEDGIFSRVAGMSEKYPGLLQVPQKIVDFDFVAFSRKIDAEIKGWESLGPYDIAIITGWKILEENIRGTRSLHKVRDVSILFNLLARDRVDIVVYSRIGGVFTIREMGLKEVKALEPPLASREMFLYLNSKHAGLVAPISESLGRMKEDGTYQSIVGSYAQP